MAKIYHNIAEMVGRTPLYRSKTLSVDLANVYLKLESYNPTSSLKDRIALSILEEAEVSGELRPGYEIFEATSGNTGIALAAIAAAKGYKITLVMPENMSTERKGMLHALGAHVILTPKQQGLSGALAQLEELIRGRDDVFVVRQFDNFANTMAHYQTTGPEIWYQTSHTIDFFIASIGSGGTLTGAGKFLREKNPNIKIVAIEPADSPVLSGGRAGPHPIQGIGPGFVPSILDTTMYDFVRPVETSDAIRTARLLAKNEGLLLGFSSAAVAYVAADYARNYPHSNIVGIAASSGERYLSTTLYQDPR